LLFQNALNVLLQGLYSGLISVIATNNFSVKLCTGGRKIVFPQFWESWTYANYWVPEVKNYPIGLGRVSSFFYH